MKTSKKILIAIGALVALGIVAGVTWYIIFIRIVRVPSGAMANTIIPGDRVLCNLYGGNLGRGDIVVFKLPVDPKVLYIKRIIGLPGETIQLRGEKVFINGQELTEARTYVNPENRQGALRELSSEGEGKYRVYYFKRDGPSDEDSPGVKYAVAEPFQIPEGHYFMLGDSRDNSFDSRFWGTVPRGLIMGKGLMIFDSEAPEGQKRAFTPLK
ncbi:MAG: signal peptidase I [Acidobacteria bacterium]|nr:signal peptidase I [Acidobacteriota bacterium]